MKFREIVAIVGNLGTPVSNKSQQSAIYIAKALGSAKMTPCPIICIHLYPPPIISLIHILLHNVHITENSQYLAILRYCCQFFTCIIYL